MTYLERVREQQPLTICITNDVVKNFTANGLLALGASPAMSEYKEDLEDFLPFAGGLLINIGTLTNDNWQLYKDALDIAERYKVPAVLDPVAVSAGAYRKKVVKDLLDHHKLSLIRGNASEISALIGKKVESKGVDSGFVADVGKLAIEANRRLGLPIVVTGVQDAVALNGKARVLSNGSSLMPLVTGTGCLLGAVLAAFLAIAKEEDWLDSLTEALLVYAIAGQLAEDKAGALPGSFQVEFLNALHTIQLSQVSAYQEVADYG
ncbi:hydroxyethylthiazole kinase [Streptococcus dentiloxodontae]